MVPRCDIVQNSEKKYIIDNVDIGAQFEWFVEYNKLVLYSAIHPAHYVAAVRAWLQDTEWQPFIYTHKFISGGKDWPDAYKHLPISFTESKGCILALCLAVSGRADLFITALRLAVSGWQL